MKQKTTRFALTLLFSVLTTIGAWAETLDGVSYIDENGVAQTADNVTVLTGGGETTLSEGWYVVNSDISYSGKITLTGDANIILADGCTMNIGTSESPLFEMGINSSSDQASLTIYGQTHDIILLGRTLYKDGDWNTLCLPFNVEDGDNTDELTFSGTPLEGATVMELDVENTYEGKQTGLDGTTLYLYFKTATEIEAGKPYLIKWANDGTTITSPVFSSVTVSSTTAGSVTSIDYTVSFKGNYSPVELEVGPSNYYLGANNKLYYPSQARTMNAFRAYFDLSNPGGGGSNAPAINNFVLNFGGETTSLREMRNEEGEMRNGAWYDLSGRKLQEKPTQKGIYIYNGKKRVIK